MQLRTVEKYRHSDKIGLANFGVGTAGNGPSTVWQLHLRPPPRLPPTQPQPNEQRCVLVLEPGARLRHVEPQQRPILLRRPGPQRLLRSGLNKLFIFSKVKEARSRLYRRQILQVNIRWKALEEIYKIYMLLHRSDLNISEIFRQTLSHFLAILILKTPKN